MTGGHYGAQSTVIELTYPPTHSISDENLPILVIAHLDEMNGIIHKEMLFLDSPEGGKSCPP